jgi:hypothetical protein
MRKSMGMTFQYGELSGISIFSGGNIDFTTICLIMTTAAPPPPPSDVPASFLLALSSYVSTVYLASVLQCYLVFRAQLQF